MSMLSNLSFTKKWITITTTVLLMMTTWRAAYADFEICKDQTYALCAAAQCTVYDGVAYCKCDVKHGDSISLPFKLSDGKDVCSVNAAGVNNGYMVSTFSPPESALAPNGDRAIYTCPAGSDGAYAQCDGGICFTSTEGAAFPGLGQLAKNQIICSCPVTKPGITSGKLIGFQILGPYPCQKSFYQYCNSSVANSHNGSTIYVGAPTGIPKLLTHKLIGHVPEFNECHLP